ncbi:hypothetical protein NEIRO03_2152 [Nematocida sp. AWRm78]|nr:hypothetical protein NEIRO02_2117 [Nematocida sp. AWRm79]KAI5185921.1 hypothetical protein NEIRO03_2152 [Nematocida sp. AWRm78]
MARYIDDNMLIEKVQEGFKDKEGKMELEDIDKLSNIVTNINREERIFTDLPEQLTILAYNILYIQIYYRILCKSIIYTEDIAISIINNSISHTDLIIDIIKEVAEELNNEDKKQAFYDLMGDNHIIIAEVYILRRKFFDYSIDTLCEKENIPELDDTVTPDDAMVKLCELTKNSKEYSRLQRVLDILMKHGNNLIIPDENGIEQSNINNLDICYDDIYSLQLFKRAGMGYFLNSNEFLKESIYGSIYIKTKYNEPPFKYSITNLYNTLFRMSINRDVQSTELYKNENINKIKEHLNKLQKTKKIDIINEIKESKILKDIENHKYFNIKGFKNNVINNYLKPVEYNTSIIINGIIKHKFKNTLNFIIIPIVIILLLVIITVFLLYFAIINETITQNFNNSFFYI